MTALLAEHRLAVIVVCWIILATGAIAYLAVTAKWEPRAPRARRVCKGGFAHYDDKVIELGDPGAMTTHTMCGPCMKLWNQRIDRAA